MLLAASLTSPSAAQPPFRVADLNTTRDGGMFAARFAARAESVVAGSVAYFPAFDGIHGDELWRSDGTPAGTYLLVDLCPGGCSSSPAALAVLDDTVYFMADDGIHGRELWRTDGTAAGTLIVADLGIGLRGSVRRLWVSLQTSLVLGNRVLFTADVGDTGLELWQTDGTAAGTSLLADIAAGPIPSNPTLLASTATHSFFVASNGDDGRELWATDGTPEGTVLVADTLAGSASGAANVSWRNPSTFAVVGSRFYFAPSNGGGLWVSEGTPAGTAQLLDGSVFPYFLAPLGQGVLFNASTAGQGRELWASDGTPGGTGPLIDILPGPAESNPAGLVAAGGRVFFSAADAAGRELWVSDGTVAGTSRLADTAPGSSDAVAYGRSLVPVGSRVLFFADSGSTGFEPWSSDGTISGTVAMTEVATGPASAYTDAELINSLHDAMVLGGHVLMRLYDADADLALWRLDPQTGESFELAEVNAQTSAFPHLAQPMEGILDRPFSALDDLLLFSADDGSTGAELWRSDGTTAGTDLVADTVAGPAGGGPGSLTPLGDFLLFAAGEYGARALWRTNGTAAATQPVGAGDEPWGLTTAGPRAYFVDEALGLTTTDGSAVGTFAVPGAPFDVLSGGPQPMLTAWEARLAFATTSGYWLTEGSAAGTFELPMTPVATRPPNFTALVGSLFFTGASASAGQELWVYDQFETRLVKDVRPGVADGILRWDQDLETAPPRKIAAAPGHGVVFLADDGASGEEPWFSAGLEGNTVLLADVSPGPRSSDPDHLTSVGQRVYFVADDGVHGRELWSTDPVSASTRLVLDIVPGPGSSVPRNLTAIGHRLLFTAYDPVHGAEAWVTDGTPEATFRLGDIAPGALSSSPAHFTAAGDLVFFAANDNVTGFELWAVPRTALDAQVTDFYTVPPCRVYDSRSDAPLTIGPRVVPVAGRCGIPATARAVAANLTVLDAVQPGNLLAAAGFAAHTRHAVLPFPTRTARAQQTILRLGYGAVELITQLSLSTEVIVDVAGWFE